MSFYNGDVMFNLYYVNYAKAFEIAMQIDNKLPEKKVIDSETSKEGEGKAGIKAPEIPLLDKIMPSLFAEGKYVASKFDKTSDTLRVVSTKSTILDPIIQKSVEIKKVGEDRVGKLIKIKDVQLKIENVSDIMGTKMLLRGMLKDVPVDGFGNIDLTDMLDVVLRGASYIATGKMPQRVELGENSPNKLMIKIPIQLGNELESQYSISDLEIGPLTIIGIYRGIFEYETIRKQIDVMRQLEGEEAPAIDIETDDIDEIEITEKDSEKVHFIDVIAIVQDLYY